MKIQDSGNASCNAEKEFLVNDTLKTTLHMQKHDTDLKNRRDFQAQNNYGSLHQGLPYPFIFQ